MHRRSVLTGALAGLGVLAGCTSHGPGTGTTTDTERDRPPGCPASQELDVEWSTELDAASVAAFVEAYEAAYYREVVVDYEPESPVDEYGLAGSVVGEPRSVGGGWVVEYRGGGGVYRPTLFLRATTATPPDGAAVVAADEIDDDGLRETVETAAETGEAEAQVEPPGEPVARYLDLLASLDGDFGLDGPGDEDRLYVDDDARTVELVVQASNFHGDYWWSARYFVTDRIVRRTSEEGVDARDGTLLECREG
jgi:hypothetical protein